MNKYFCELGLLHDEADKISGNGCWYSALYHSMGGLRWLQAHKILEEKFVFHKYIPDYRIKTIRYPDNPALDSHDDILGHLYFGSLTANDLDKTGWYINSTLPSDFTWMECFKDIIRLVKKHGVNPHRNIWWQDGYRAIAKIANRLPSWLKYYAKPRAKYYVPFMAHILFSYLKPNFKNGVRQTNNVSSKIQSYFMLKSINSRYLILLFNIKKLSGIYFPKDHPVCMSIKQNTKE